MLAAEWFVRILSTYVALGVLFAVVFVMVGIHKVDPVAKGSSIGFRLLILPGAVALWPLLLLRLLRRGARS